MRDLLMFTTEFGVASLILKEIPYREEAYILVQSTQEPEKLLRECIDFCRACGAERIYARGHEILERYPLHSIVYEMRGTARVDEAKTESLWPVTEETVSRWRELMNQRMRGVDNAATLEKKGEREILDKGGAYFVHRNGQLLGGGWLAGQELLLVASLIPGAGERVCHTLFSLIPDEEVRLEVVSTNTRAIRLYERLGFLKTGECRKWYRVY